MVTDLVTILFLKFNVKNLITKSVTRSIFFGDQTHWSPNDIDPRYILDYTDIDPRYKRHRPPNRPEVSSINLSCQYQILAEQFIFMNEFIWIEQLKDLNLMFANCAFKFLMNWRHLNHEFKIVWYRYIYRWGIF
jgi:hypothetical protein